MDENADFLAAARAAIEKFGDKAAQIMEGRADAHKRLGEPDGEQFWRRVSEVVRAILDGHAE